jgi:hypothetical protein
LFLFHENYQNCYALVHGQGFAPDLVVAGLEGGEHDPELSASKTRVLDQVLDHVDLGAKLQNPCSDNDVLKDGKQLVHAPTVFHSASGLTRSIDFSESLEQNVQLFEGRKRRFDLLQRFDGRRKVSISNVRNALSRRRHR